MPGLDGTGPAGQGALTGGGRGPCGGGMGRNAAPGGAGRGAMTGRGRGPCGGRMRRGNAGRMGGGGRGWVNQGVVPQAQPVPQPAVQPIDAVPEPDSADAVKPAPPAAEAAADAPKNDAKPKTRKPKAKTAKKK